MIKFNTAEYLKETINYILKSALDPTNDLFKTSTGDLDWNDVRDTLHEYIDYVVKD